MEGVATLEKACYLLSFSKLGCSIDHWSFVADQVSGIWHTGKGVVE